MWETTPRPKSSIGFGITFTNGLSRIGASQETMEVLIFLSSLQGQEFYHGVATYLIGKKKQNWKDTSLLLMNWNCTFLYDN